MPIIIRFDSIFQTLSYFFERNKALQLIVQSMKNGQLPLSNLLGAAGSVKTEMNSSFENEAKVTEETDDEDDEGNLVIAGEETGVKTGEGDEVEEIMEIELPGMIKNEVKSESEDENIEDIETPAAKLLKLSNGQGVQMS